jgi:universal stress protein A
MTIAGKWSTPGGFQMFKHVLVPTDLTEKSTKSLDIALGVYQTGNGRVTLLHVIETIQDDEGEDFQGFYKKLEKRAVKVMDKIVGRYSHEHFSLEARLVYGNRVAEIIKFAEEESVDLIVLSSHPVDPTNLTHGWGTISYKVGILANCPVMLIK